ncbi:hypothetical protein K491DRAFT_486024 [Lophiostoma macrostomum CBS 122681]|uniref:Protein transport protein SEC9 n=1 Tax=Lophiostoma macrostomum CBS 122681 TaxID=1314788 RepID=A0A6A6T2T8_9PLEO|nr:hypothetical protein K491DRAFT_486024 [Lophiostoma macrostomum CBS 122681]
MVFGRKKDTTSEDASRSALFGSRKQDKATPPASNPYAAPATGKDPYGAPPPYQGSGANRSDEKSPSVTAPGQRYGGQQRAQYGQSAQGGGGYGAQPGYSSQGASYGSSGAYGTERYSGGGGAQDQAPRRAGGYGGLGRTNSNETMSTDAGRDALFGGARERQQQQQQRGGAYGQQQSGAYGQQSGAYGGAGEQAGGYGAYEQRELTAEEQEEEDISATKNEIKFIKQQDVSSTRNALRAAEMAEQTGRDTLARLGAQGERIYNTEKNLDLASTQNRIATEKAKELKTLNKSMFAMHVGNPFTSNSRREERDRKVLETHRQERDARDATRKAAWDASVRGEDAQRQQQELRGTGQRNTNKSTLADRARFQFEADSEDDEMENEIDGNLDALHGAAKRLNALGRAMGTEVEQQNAHIDRIINKTDRVDDEVAMNRARLDRIH